MLIPAFAGCLRSLAPDPLRTCILESDPVPDGILSFEGSIISGSNFESPSRGFGGARQRTQARFVQALAPSHMRLDPGHAVNPVREERVQGRGANHLQFTLSPYLILSITIATNASPTITPTTHSHRPWRFFR